MNYTDGIIKNSEFFTTAELAKKLKMNVQVITRKVQAGEIEAYKIGKEWRIPERSVFAWLEKNTNTNGTPARKPRVVTNLVRKTAETPQLSNQHATRKHLLEYILAQFEPNREYSPDEVDRRIQRYHTDSTTVR
ncbi:MAG: helix-turn-helix domain-containing protein, partial [candidate division Zixibacteria bacterium]|nr:helix-turn-helix domain-containing protein [candidate division Zixibacteria bacterium]